MLNWCEFYLNQLFEKDERKKWYCQSTQRYPRYDVFVLRTFFIQNVDRILVSGRIIVAREISSPLVHFFFLPFNFLLMLEVLTYKEIKIKKKLKKMS